MPVMKKRVIQHITSWLASHSKLSFVIGVILTSVLSIGIGQLRMETDYQVFFSPGDKEIEQFHEFQKHFGREDTLYFSINARDGRTLFKVDHLKAISKFTRLAKTLPNVRRVASIANFPLVDSAKDDINIGPAYEVDGGVFHSSMSMKQMQRRLTSEPSAKNKLISIDGRTAGFFVVFTMAKDNRSQEAASIWLAANKLLEKMRHNYPDLQFRVTGSIALDSAFVEANQRDLSTLFPAAITMIIILAAVIFRSFVFYLALSLVVVAATLSCLGFAGWVDIPLSSVSLTSPVIVIIIATAGMVHLFVSWDHQRDNEGVQRLTAAIDKIFMPAFLTTLTTAAGLFMLNFSATPPFRDLGNIASFGVLMAFLYTFLLGSPLVLLAKRHQEKSVKLQVTMEKLADLVVRPKVQLYALLLSGVMIVIAACSVLNDVDDNYIHYFDHSFEFRKDSDFIDGQLSGIYTLEYMLSSKSSTVYAADYLHFIHDFSQWAMKQSGVRSVDSLEDVISQVNRAFHNGIERFRVAPNNDNLIEQYGVLYEMSVPQDFSLRNRVSASQNASRMTVYLSNLSIVEVDALEKRARQWLNKNQYFSNLSGSYSATGTSIIFSHIGLNNIYSMINGIILLFAMATALMGLIFRKISFAFVATIANIIPALVAIGLWGLFVGRIGMGSATVVAVTLGLVIDDTIHFGYRYMYLRRLGENVDSAIRNTLIQVGPAILVTSIILFLGFLIIAYSAFEVNAALGAMVAMTILIALVFDLFVLPSLLIKLSAHEYQALKGGINES